MPCRSPSSASATTMRSRYTRSVRRSVGLDRLRRELGARRDVADLTVIALVGRIGRHFDRTHPARTCRDPARRHTRARTPGRATRGCTRARRRHDAAGFTNARQHHAVARREQFGIGQLRFGLAALRDRCREFGTARVDFFAAKSFARKRERFALRGEPGGRLVASCLRRVARCFAGAAGLEHDRPDDRTRAARSDTRLRPLRRAPAPAALPAAANLSRTSPSSPVASCTRASASATACAIRLGVDGGEPLALRDDVAFVDQHLDDPARHAKPEFDLANVDVAVQRQRRSARLCASALYQYQPPPAAPPQRRAPTANLPFELISYAPL